MRSSRPDAALLLPSSHHFPQPSTKRNPFLVTSNLDRGIRQCTNGGMSVCLRNSSLMKNEGTGPAQRRQGKINPRFREISDVSCLFPRFCGYSRLFQDRKHCRINSLDDADKRQQGSTTSLYAANPLFQNILRLSGLFSRFCGYLTSSRSAKHFRINILSSSLKKKEGMAGHSNGSKCGDFTPSVANASSMDLATCNSGRVDAPEI
jgi:hypothetical protein